MYSYMEGAMESGIRAALEVLNFIKPQSLTPQELKVVNTYYVKYLCNEADFRLSSRVKNRNV